MNRMFAMALAAAIALPLAPAQAAPFAAPAAPDANIVKVADGCGRGWHRNPWGRCVPNRYYREFRRPPAIYFGFGPRWHDDRRWHRRHWRHHDRW